MKKGFWKEKKFLGPIVAALAAAGVLSATYAEKLKQIIDILTGG